MGLLKDFLKKVRDFVADEAGTLGGKATTPGRFDAIIAKDKEALRNRQRLDKQVAKERERQVLDEIARDDKRQAKREKQVLDPKDANDPFLRFMRGEWHPVASSNVSKIRYLSLSNNLDIEYHTGSIYRYYEVRPEEASAFWDASSKGTWVWDELRVRKTIFGCKKAYRHIGGPPPKYAKGYGTPSAPGGWRNGPPPRRRRK